MYHAGKNVYLPVFCFEGLISEFPKFTYRFPSLRASFSSQVKNVGHRIYSWGAVFQSGKNTILFHFLIFFACKNSTIQHTFSAHHTQYTTTHSIQDPQYISTAHHITSHHLTSHHMAPHGTTWHHITPHYTTSQHITCTLINNTPPSTTAQTRHSVVCKQWSHC